LYFNKFFAKNIVLLYNDAEQRILENIAIRSI